MDRRRLTLPAAALACVVLLAGCGSSNSSSTTSTSSSSSSTSAPSSSQTSSATTSAPVAGSSDAKEAVSECKKIIQGDSKLPAGAKEKLEGACAEAAKGDTAAVKKAAREVCEEVIDRSGVPGGAAKEAALKACKK